MTYKAVGDLVAVDFSEFDYYMKEEEAIRILKEKGFEVLDVNLCEIARNFVGSNIRYKKDALMREAPMAISCSSWTKWLFSQKGINIPRYALNQREAFPVCHELLPETLIFKRSGRYYRKDTDERVGHVGLFTENKTIIHAIDAIPAIVEISFNDFLEQGGGFLGMRQVIANPQRTKTLRVPPECEIEDSDEINRILWATIDRK